MAQQSHRSNSSNPDGIVNSVVDNTKSQKQKMTNWNRKRLKQLVDKLENISIFQT